MGFESYIARKHLTHRQKTGFVSLVTLLTVLGIAIGVAVLIIVLGVMRGFDRDYKTIFVNVQPHLRIDRVQGIENPDAEIEKIQQMGILDLTSVAAFVEGQGILQAGEQALGIAIKGLDVAHEELTIYDEHMVDGILDFESKEMVQTKRRFFFFKKKVTTEIPGMVIGEGLAYRLGVHTGDRVTLITPTKKKSGGITLTSAESHPFVIKGVFQVGLSDFDSNLALVSLPAAQKVYHLGNRAQGLSLRFRDVDQAPQWKAYFRRQYPSEYLFHTWHDLNAVFFQAVEVERSLLNILLAGIILVAGFNITSILILVVTEKTKDIGIMRALGATRGSIRKIFLLEGFSIGFFGVVAGTITGLLVLFYRTPIREFLKEGFGLDIFPSDVYYLKIIPAEINPNDIVFIVGFALLASLLAGLYPAHRAASLRPVEALRYE